MGIVPCPLVCQSNKESAPSPSSTNSESASLHSQPSLPTVPSLTCQSFRQKTAPAHYQCISTLRGHSSYVFSLALAGKFLYSGSSDNEIRIWSRQTPEEEQDPENATNKSSNSNIIAIGKGAVKSVVVYGDKLFSAHHDNKIRVWQINNDETNHQKYKKLATLPTLSDRLMRLLPAKNHVQVRRHKKCTWVHHVDAISALVISRDGSRLYSVSWDRTFKIWRTTDFKCLESVANVHDDAINAVALSTDGFVYTGSADKKIKVWSKLPGNKKHSLVAILEKHKSAVNALALSADGSTLYSGACDRSIVVWQKDGGGGGGGDGGGGEGSHMVVVGALRGHTKAILCLTIVSDLICSGSADKTVRIWRKGIDNSYSCLAVLEEHKAPVKCLTAAIDNGDSTTNSHGNSSVIVYSGSLDNDIKVCQVFVPYL